MKNEAGSFIKAGDRCVESGDLRGAVENYTRAIELRTTRSEVYNNRGQVLAALGEHEKAIADLERFLKLKSDRRFTPLIEEELRALKLPKTVVILGRVTKSELKSCLCGAGEYGVATPLYLITTETEKGTISFETTEFHGKYSLITIYQNADTGEVLTSGYLLR